MDKRTTRTGAATLVALAVLVLLALPAQPALALSAAPAAGSGTAPPGLLPSLWTWVTKIATRATDGLADLWQATTDDPLADPQRGHGIDPDGAPSTQATTDPLPEPERGHGIDPDG